MRGMAVAVYPFVEAYNHQMASINGMLLASSAIGFDAWPLWQRRVF